MQAIKKRRINQVLEILTTDPGSKKDIPTWAKATHQELISFEERNPEKFRFLVKRLKKASNNQILRRRRGGVPFFMPRICATL